MGIACDTVYAISLSHSIRRVVARKKNYVAEKIDFHKKPHDVGRIFVHLNTSLALDFYILSAVR
jgi:hypothetical protein